MLVVAAIPAVLPGHTQSSPGALKTHGAALACAAEVLAAVPACAASNAQADVTPVVFLMLIGLAAAPDAATKASALRALRTAVQATEDTDTLCHACAHALHALDSGLGMQGGEGGNTKWKRKRKRKKAHAATDNTCRNVCHFPQLLAYILTVHHLVTVNTVNCDTRLDCTGGATAIPRDEL